MKYKRIYLSDNANLKVLSLKWTLCLDHHENKYYLMIVNFLEMFPNTFLLNLIVVIVRRCGRQSPPPPSEKFI